MSPLSGARTSRSLYSTLELDQMTHEEWKKAFKNEIQDIVTMDIKKVTYEDSAEQLRKLVRSKILQHDDIIKKPERFFEAHRILAHYSPDLGPGFWIRFTVHFNLCVGTICGLGSKSHVELIEKWQTDGQLGCFSLTEKFAGVNSGLVVETTADFVADKFILNSPSHGSKKNWISQGLVADKSTVVADLRIQGKSYGPHAFVMNLRENGKVVPGVTLEDMGRKTIGNDLDNAWIAFDNVELPKSALLNRYADIVDGKYVQSIKGMPVFHMIGQRLFTGRVAVAQVYLTPALISSASARLYFFTFLSPPLRPPTLRCDRRR